MNRFGIKRGLLTLTLALLAIPMLHAQERQQYASILEALQASLPGQGMIRVIQSPEIQSRIGKPSGAIANARIVNGYAILQGYRIQAYSGNLGNSRSIASSRENQIRNAMPQHEVSVEYDAPFWRVRVGNFVDRGEAQQALGELQKEFPGFAREMYIVRTQIKIPQ